MTYFWTLFVRELVSSSLPVPPRMFGHFRLMYFRTRIVNEMYQGLPIDPNRFHCQSNPLSLSDPFLSMSIETIEGTNPGTQYTRKDSWSFVSNPNVNITHNASRIGAQANYTFEASSGGRET
ncbi:glycoside hydrolase family 18 protein, partial [Moniliophthora roreri]